MLVVRKAVEATLSGVITLLVLLGAASPSPSQRGPQDPAHAALAELLTQAR